MIQNVVNRNLQITKTARTHSQPRFQQVFIFFLGANMADFSCYKQIQIVRT
jgi:hypothetical protein